MVFVRSHFFPNVHLTSSTFFSYLWGSIQLDGSKKNLSSCTAATPLTTAIEPAHVAAKTFPENWVSNKVFFCFDIDNGLKNIFLGVKLLASQDRRFQTDA